MTDLDFAMPAKRFPEAAGLLVRPGLRSAPGPPPVTVGAGAHAGTFVDVNGTGIDLHRNVLFASRWDDADRSFWRHAVPGAGVPTPYRSSPTSSRTA
jgi:hypothetical protein